MCGGGSLTLELNSLQAFTKLTVLMTILKITGCSIIDNFRVQVIMTLHRFLFIIYKCPWILGKDGEMVSCCLLHGSEFTVFLSFVLFFVRLTKIVHSIFLFNPLFKREEIAFPRTFLWKWMQQMNSEIELSLPRILSTPNIYYITCSSTNMIFFLIWYFFSKRNII